MPQMLRFVIALLLAVATTTLAWVSCADVHDIRRSMALLSAAAYCNPALVETWTCLPCINFTKFNPAPSKVVSLFDAKTDTQGYVLFYMSGGLDVVFRGSASLQNWITDMKALPLKQYPPWSNKTRDPYDVGVPSVHPGFLEAFLSVRDQMYAAILQLCPGICTRKCTIQFAGHSLGAALAAMAQVDYTLFMHDMCGASSYPAVSSGVWTFGEPRVGDEIFSKLYWHKNLVHCRVTHAADVVVHLPPSALGYLHEGNEEVFFFNSSDSGGGNTLCACDPSGPHWEYACEDPRCSDGVKDVEYNTQDHVNYMGYAISNMCMAT